MIFRKGLKLEERVALFASYASHDYSWLSSLFTEHFVLSDWVECDGIIMAMSSCYSEFKTKLNFIQNFEPDWKTVWYSRDGDG